MRKMFSKNQIKEVVNEGIQEGEIQSGSKLYYHKLVDDSGDIIIEFISPDNFDGLEFTTELISKMLFNAVIIRNINDKDGNGYLYGSFYDTSNSVKAWDFIENAQISVDLSNTTWATHEVEKI